MPQIVLHLAAWPIPVAEAAAALEGMRCVGWEVDAHAARITRRRVMHWMTAAKNPGILG